MKKTITLLFLLISIFSQAQTPITANGFKFKQGNKSFSFKKVAGLVQNNMQANQRYWEARTDRSNSFLYAGFGAVGMGIPVYTAVKRGSASWFFTRFTMPLMAGGIICEVARSVKDIAFVGVNSGFSQKRNK